MARIVSPFLDPGSHTKAGSLAIVQLSRDNLEPLYLQDADGDHDGYAEGAVLNTRFGSFPHSTLLDVPWGSQIRASKVDTGSRGRKRKRNDAKEVGRENGTPAEGDTGDGDSTPAQAPKKLAKEAVAAASGFIHILPPTPEIWTMSLPHRTQVVYTPDYSYILHKIRARPGTRLIEAGAGSGSFTHAAARAIYNGYPPGDGGQTTGTVFSFEFHQERFHKMTRELQTHGLDGVVRLIHRDVYQDGFLVDGKSPEAEAIFLDLPAPWRALPHLSRQKPSDLKGLEIDHSEDGTTSNGWISPLNRTKSIYICTFSPCVEQVTRTVSTMRRLGWVEIETVEIANRRIQTYRENIGLNLPPMRNMTQSPRDVMEAVTRLRDIEDKFREHNKKMAQMEDSDAEMDLDGDEDVTPSAPVLANGAETPDATDDSRGSTKPWMEGRLVTRTELEMKAHTSYLVFAVLPREWTAADEAAAVEKWPCGREKGVIGNLDREARKEEKRKLFHNKKRDR